MRYYQAFTDDGEEFIHTSKKATLKWIGERPGSYGFLVISERDGTLVSSVRIEDSGHKYRDNRVVSMVTPTGRL